MLVYRIVHKKYSNTLSASGIEGRWNSAGNKVIYCAESIALAFLENMIRRQGVGFNDDFKIMIISIPDITKITLINSVDLSPDWRDPSNYFQCRQLGNKWYGKGKTLLLKVPSAVLPEGFNFVINSLHDDYNKVKFIGSSDLIPDKRIEDILKKYS
ncbi:MAG TPA: RES family NAD+ phosphorylase [Hanamia sp.]|nr:RES family NAD+ phosphorylase [Hanamia sp.]